MADQQRGISTSATLRKTTSKTDKQTMKTNHAKKQNLAAAASQGKSCDEADQIATTAASTDVSCTDGQIATPGFSKTAGTSNMMAMRLLIALLVTAFVGFTNTAKADIIGTTTYKGKTFYVDVRPSGSNADIWLRVSKSACSTGDKHVALISRSTKVVKKGVTVKDVASTVCSVKELYDSGKTAAGCLATGATAMCLAASAPMGETTAVLCLASLDYTIDKGAADCLEGVSNKVAEWLVGSAGWNSFAAGYKVGALQWKDAIDHTIDLACSHVK